MKHLILLFAMVLTCVLAAVANVIIDRMVGINIFTFKAWFVIPVGAGIVGAAGASGAILAARYFNIQPTIIDALVMVAVAAGTMALIYYLDYATLVLDDGRKASDLVSFDTYVDFVLTKSHMRVGRGAGIDTGEVGQMGYVYALVEFLGFLVGGAFNFIFIKGLPRCADCSAYLRKLKTKKTKELTFGEADKIIELFKAGDADTIQGVMAWRPPERTLDRKSEKALITYDLLGCPKCKAEVVVAKVNAFNGKEWKEVPALQARRNLTGGWSLRDQFV